MAVSNAWAETATDVPRITTTDALPLTCDCRKERANSQYGDRVGDHLLDHWRVLHDHDPRFSMCHTGTP